MVSMRVGLGLGVAVAAIGLAVQVGSRANASPAVLTGAAELAGAKHVSIENANGDVRVVPATGTAVHVTATVRRGDPGGVQIVTLRSGDEMHVCVQKKNVATCRLEDMYRYQIDLLVALPAAAPASIENGNGDVETLAGTRIDAVSSGNGSATVAANGPITAALGNGSLMLAFDATPWSGNVHARVGNGTITVRLPKNASASVSATSGNGRITVGAQSAKGMLETTLGAASDRRFELSTGNGSIKVSTS